MDASDLVPLLAVVMAVGAVGTVVPLLPGLALVWGAGLVYGLVEGFDAVGGVAFAAMSVLAAGGTVAGWVVPKRRASGAGAGRTSVWLGIAAAVVGFFVVPVVGLALGGVLGIYVGENLRTHDPAAAWVTTRATIVGFGVAALIQLGRRPGDDRRVGGMGRGVVTIAGGDRRHPPRRRGHARRVPSPVGESAG